MKNFITLNLGPKMDSTKTLTLKSTTDHHSSSRVQSPRNHFHSHVLMVKVSPTRPVVSLVNSCTLMHTLSRILKKLMKMETLSDKLLLGKNSKIIVMVISDHLNRKRGIVDFIRGFENLKTSNITVNYLK